MIYELDVGGKEWEAFREAIEIRKRITHPKHTSDMDVPNNDLNQEQRATEWYRQHIEGLLAVCR